MDSFAATPTPSSQSPSPQLTDSSPGGLLAPDTPLFTAARQARLRWPARGRAWYPLAVLAAGLLIPFIGQILGGIIGSLLLMPFMENPLDFLFGGGSTAGFVSLLLIGFLPMYPLVWLWLRLFERRKFVTVGFWSHGAAAKYARGLLIGLLMFSMGVLIMYLMGDVEVSAVDWQAATVTGVLFVFIGWIVQGAAEEVLARGFLLPIVGAHWTPLIGVILSSSIFGLLHLFNDNLQWLAMLNLILFGVFAAFYALWEEGLWGICAIHSVWNWAQGNVFGFPVSGNAESSAILWKMAETGPDLLTGGAFGPEGGLIVSLVLIAACIGVWIAARRKPQRNPS
ncbi:MAG: CPBP family intramembrane metalloprotease [Caldilineaceae bacterium]|nr:CPBP family intramembrane metalloprotease [Caldilineaceae bacterium]